MKNKINLTFIIIFILIILLGNYTLINNIPYIFIAIIFMFPIKTDFKYQDNQIYNIINKIIY